MESTIAIATLFGAIFSAVAAITEAVAPSTSHPAMTRERLVDALSTSLVVDQFLTMSDEELRSFSDRMVKTSHKFREELTGSDVEDYEKAWELFQQMRVDCVHSSILFGTEGVKRILTRYGIEFSINIVEGSKVEEVFKVHKNPPSKVSRVIKWVAATLVGGLILWAQVKLVQRSRANTAKMEEMNNTILGLREENDYLNKLDPKVDFFEYLGNETPDLHISNMVHF